MLDFPSLGVWGALLVWGEWAWGVGPAGLLVRALGKYLDPAGNRDRYGPQNPAHGGILKFPGTVLVVCRRKGSRVTW